MPQVLGFQIEGVNAAVDRIVRDLVSVRHMGDGSFISLPLAYPSGSYVTVRIDRSKGGFRVSDNGFAFREAESLGAARGFSKTAETIAQYDAVSVGKRIIYVEGVSDAELVRAICDVGKASSRVADKIVGKAAEEAAEELEDHLRYRLISVFGEANVKSDGPQVIGASTSEWDVSAVVEVENHKTVFQAVANHSNSIFRTNALFDDLNALERPPKLVAFVQSKESLGKRLAILARSGNVIEQGQPDSIFVRAAA
jgi:hypothetical protein